ncbi:hypothetical protein SCYAM73S_00541 [Streptomyces cyaneofuscatus]
MTTAEIASSSMPTPTMVTPEERRAAFSAAASPASSPLSVSTRIFVRATGRPVRVAASLLPPTANRVCPNEVRWSSRPPAPKRTTAMRIG